MKVQDFGVFDGPLVLFGGGYSNLHALSALFDAEPGLPMISTGDLVGYCADPEETVALFLRRGIPGIAGNCERQAASGAEDCGCGFEDGTACDLLSRGWYAHLSAALSPGARAELADLADLGTFTHDGRRYGVVHGGATANNRFLWPSDDDAAFAAEIAAFEAAAGPVDAIVAGHSGIAFQRDIGRHRWINAGAIGLPPHDGRPETRYALLDAGEVTFRRLDYDHAAARAAMEAAGLTQGYHAALSTGHWPSEDVLPPALRR